VTNVRERLTHPEGAWGWGAAVAASAVVVVPQIVVLAIVPETRNTASAARTIGLIVNTVVVASGIYMYLHHRLTRADSTGWLASSLIVIGGVGLTVTGVDLTMTPQESMSVPVTVVDLGVLGGLLVAVWIAERVPLVVDPAAVGLLVGAAACALTLVATSAGPPLTVTQSATPVVVTVILAIAIVVALRVRRLVTLAGWARDRLAFALVALFASRALVAGDPDSPAAHLGAVLAGTVAATLVLGTSLATLRLAIHDDHLAITALRDQLAATAAFARADRDRLHEVKATIAGIASASRLIHHDTLLPGPSRELLEEMLERESARLQRLVQGDAPGPIGVVHLDEALPSLVVARQAQGQRVSWRPCGLAVWAREDDLSEVVNILLDNAAKHAPDASVTVFAVEAGDNARIVVADSGPGVPADLRPALFERGVRGDSSAGTGLGLYLARRLMIRSGGFLRLDESVPSGAAFVVSTRVARHFLEGRRDDDAAHVLPQ
jgi:signal transduction histidine kinase